MWLVGLFSCGRRYWYCLLGLIVWFGIVACWFGFSCVVCVVMIACRLVVGV